MRGRAWIINNIGAAANVFATRAKRRRYESCMSVSSSQRTSTFRRLALLGGFAFLYVPIISIVVYSFNASSLVTVWSGFSTRWYRVLFGNRQILDAALLSLKIAAINATGATILGTLAGFSLARF